MDRKTGNRDYRQNAGKCKAGRLQALISVRGFAAALIRKQESLIGKVEPFRTSGGRVAAHELLDW